jgi:hypothetical protein
LIFEPRSTALFLPLQEERFPSSITQLISEPGP